MKTTKTLALASFVILGAIAMAQPSMGDNNRCGKCDNMSKSGKMQKCNKGNKGNRGGEMIFSQLNLTDAQKQKFQELRDNKQAMRSENRGKLRPKMSDFVTPDSFNKQKFIEAQVTHANIRANMMAQSFEERFNILTPEQKKEYIKLLKEREERMQTRGKR